MDLARFMGLKDLESFVKHLQRRWIALKSWLFGIDKCTNTLRLDLVQLRPSFTQNAPSSDGLGLGLNKIHSKTRKVDGLRALSTFFCIHTRYSVCGGVDWVKDVERTACRALKYPKRPNVIPWFQNVTLTTQFAKTNSVPLYPLKISQPGDLKVLYTPVRSILPNTAHMASYSSAGLLFTAFKPRINELLIKLLTNWVNPQLDFGIRNTLTLFPSSDIDKIPCLPLRWNHRNHDGQGSFFRGGWKDADGNSGRHHRRSSIYRLK